MSITCPSLHLVELRFLSYLNCGLSRLLNEPESSGGWTMYIHNCSDHRPSDHHRTVSLMTVKEAVFMQLKHEFFKHICFSVQQLVRM